MTKSRLEAFSDGVIAIIITIMVLELRVPHGATLADLRPLVPVLMSYILSFIYVGIYWANHHHLLQAIQRVDGRALWANLHLLFWLSLVPATTAWMGETRFAEWPVAFYGIVLLGAAGAYYLLSLSLIALHGRESLLRSAVGNVRKERLSLALYVLAVAVAFVERRVASALYVAVAIIWLVPDRRIEDRLRSP
jgi:uncharacterized membrane protein